MGKFLLKNKKTGLKFLPLVNDVQKALHIPHKAPPAYNIIRECSLISHTKNHTNSADCKKKQDIMNGSAPVHRTIKLSVKFKIVPAAPNNIMTKPSWLTPKLYDTYA